MQLPKLIDDSAEILRKNNLPENKIKSSENIEVVNQ